MDTLKGDLLILARNGQFDVIVHGANCFCTMGSGIARQIRTQYPEAYDADLNTIPGDRTKLGTYTQVRTRDGFTIVNAYTQYRFNRFGESNDVFEYEAFDRILQNLAEEFPTSKFGFPMIGMGLAGGDPKRIIPSIENFGKILEASGGAVTLVEF